MNRKIDDIIAGKKDRKNIRIIVLMLFFLSGSILGLMLVTNFVGFVYQNYLSGQAGYVYETILDYRECAYMWSGVYGFAEMIKGENGWSEQISSCSLSAINISFNCLAPGIDHEIMASQVPSSTISWDTLRPATTLEVDQYMGVDPTNSMSATKTFTQQHIYQIGQNAYTVFGTSTKKTGNATDINFDMGVLRDRNGNLIFISHILKNSTYGFDNQIYNYQMILPLRNGTNPVYYFFSDPFDQCSEEGSGSGLTDAPPVTETSTQETIASSSTGSFDFAKSETLGVTTIDVTVKDGTTGTFTVADSDKPTGSPLAIASTTGAVYNYIQITSTIPNSNIATATIKFKVPKTWFTTENIDYTTIALKKLVNNVWVEYATTSASEGSSYYYYETVVSSFSSYVIVGKYTNATTLPATPILEQPKRIEGIDYGISLSKIDRKIVVGNFLQEIVSFYNYRSAPANLNFSIEGENLTKLIKLDKSSMIIPPNTNDQLTLTIFGEGTPGIYNGSLVVDGTLQQKIPIHIELLSKDRLPVESILIFTDIYNRKIFSFDKLKFKTDLRNMLSDQSYPVTLQFTIQDITGSTVWSDQSNVFVQTSFSLLKTAELPKNLSNGNYVLGIRANYLGVSSSTSAVFSVVSPFYDQYLFGMSVWIWIILLVFFLPVILVSFFMRKHIRSKKHYAAKVSYTELPKVGLKSMFVGKIAETDHKTYFDLEQFKMHTIVAGATGGGKSVAAQVIVEEALMKGIAVIVFDPIAEWSGMLRKGIDKNMLKLYPQFGLKATDARSFNGNVRQITNALEVIDIKKYINPGEVQIFTLNKLDPEDIDIFVANSIREIFHANFPENSEIKLLIVYDEVHRLLPKFSGSGEGFLQIERGCREFRKWGIGMLLISQVLADFVGQIKANINTEIQMRTRDEGDIDRIKAKYGTDVLQGLVEASVGFGMVENPAYNNGRPYFVSFRPLLHNTQRLSDEELEKYDNCNEIIDDLHYQLEQLDAEKQDVFGLKLELKLALDKVKSGNFTMVEIYLQELVPRIEKIWKHLNKVPKKRELKLVDIASLKSELKKAEESRNEFEKEQHTMQAKATDDFVKILDEDKSKNTMLFTPQTSLAPQTLSVSSTLPVSPTPIRPEQYFYTVDHLILQSLRELSTYLTTCSPDAFAYHVNSTRNDFANWIRGVFLFNSLADTIQNITDKNEMHQHLEEFLQKIPAQIDPVVGSSTHTPANPSLQESLV